MSKKDSIIKGTFILTITGFLSRFIGFFYRIFLSHTFGEEGVGLYQLIFPIFALCFSFTTAGIEVALSRIIAQKSTAGKQHEARQTLFIGMGISLSLSILVMLFLQFHAVWIAENFLRDIRCTNLLIAMSYTFPFSAVHSCICGYYLGIKHTRIPAVSQLIEQTVRVLSVYIICMLMLKQNFSLSVTIAVSGLVFGEIASSLYCVFTISKHGIAKKNIPFTCRNYFTPVKELLALSIPLTANRVLLNVLQSIEAVSIPGCLILSGLSRSSSLSTYGVLTGMALPCILFPSAITNSVSTMLLPTIAEVQLQQDRKNLISLIKKVTFCVFLLGCICTAGFLITGNVMGTLLFHSHTAGKFIVTLAWICPFLYSNSALISILNGLGKAATTFLINTTGLLIRITSIFICVPAFGIIGYLWGLLASQFLISILALCTLNKYFSAH